MVKTYLALQWFSLTLVPPGWNERHIRAAGEGSALTRLLRIFCHRLSLNLAKMYIWPRFYSSFPELASGTFCLYNILTASFQTTFNSQDQRKPLIFSITATPRLALKLMCSYHAFFASLSKWLGIYICFYFYKLILFSKTCFPQSTHRLGEHDKLDSLDWFLACCYKFLLPAWASHWWRLHEEDIWAL